MVSAGFSDGDAAQLRCSGEENSEEKKKKGRRRKKEEREEEEKKRENEKKKKTDGHACHFITQCGLKIISRPKMWVFLQISLLHVGPSLLSS